MGSDEGVEKEAEVEAEGAAEEAGVGVGAGASAQMVHQISSLVTTRERKREDTLRSCLALRVQRKCGENNELWSFRAPCGITVVDTSNSSRCASRCE